MSENSAPVTEAEENYWFNEKDVISAFEELLKDPAFSQKVLAASASNENLNNQTKAEIQTHILALQLLESNASMVVKNTHSALLELKNDISPQLKNYDSTLA